MLSAEGIVRKTLFGLLKDKYLVYEDVPENAHLPYIVLGGSTELDYSTKTESGAEVIIYLHIFSDYNGYKQLITISDDIIQILDSKEFAESGNQIWMKIDSIELTDEQPYKHAVIKVRAKVI